MKNMNEDHTRRILNIIREGKDTEASKLITEQEEMLAPTDEMMPDDFETAEVEVEDEAAGEDRDLDESELREEEDKFRQTVHNRVKFNKFKLYPASQNVEWGGEFTDSRMEWNYSLDDSRGVYITSELLQLDDDTLDVIKKLVGYYKAWSDDWATRIAEEYNNKIRDNENVEDDGETAKDEYEGLFEPGDDLPEIDALA
tara:strand:- start:8 stop:604 length:597 start_codon:yes stop_codon:yes gene_type:complete